MNLTLKAGISPSIPIDYIKIILLGLRTVGVSVLVAGLMACGGGGSGGAAGIPNVNVNPSSVNFGAVIVGSNVAQTVTVSNSGNASLTLGTITTPTLPFTHIGGTCTNGQTLAAASSCTIILQFTPSAAIVANANFSIPSDDPDVGTANGQNNLQVSLTGSGTVPPVSTTTYLHYTSAPTATSVAGTLTTIDPAAPTTTTNTNPALVNSSQVYRYRTASVETASFSGGTLSDVHRYAAVFSSGGVIKKQSAVVGTSVPAAVQISNASGITAGPGDGTVNVAAATDLCELETFADFQSPDSSVVLYALAGPDNTCGNPDDVYSWLRLNTPASTAPTRIAVSRGKPIPIYSTSTLGITGFLTLDALGALIKLDANLANPAATTNGNGSFTELETLVDFTGNGHMLLLVGNSIRTYDPASNTLNITNLATVSQPSSFYNYISDGANFYFVDNPLPNGTTNVIQRISLTTTTPGPATTVVTEATGARIEELYWRTPSRLVYTLLNGTNKSVQSITKLAANATTSTLIYPTAPTTDFLQVVGSASTGRVYINRTTTAGAVTAAVINDDGTGLAIHADAAWNAGFTPATFNLYGESHYLGQTILLARNAVGKTTDDGAQLTAYDAASHTAGVVLGNVPSDIVYMYFGFGFGPRVLWTGARTGFLGSDIFYVDILSAGSLTRVTNDAAVEQQLI